MNSRFMDKAGWTASVNKMINAFGAPIAKADVEPIATYLAQNYGTQDSAFAAPPCGTPAPYRRRGTRGGDRATRTRAGACPRRDGQTR